MGFSNIDEKQRKKINGEVTEPLAASFFGTVRSVERGCPWGAWVAQSVKQPTSAQVMISWSVSSGPASGSVLTARSLEPVSDSVSPSL